MNDILPGDYVQLIAREAPHRDAVGWWWEVTAVTDRGLDVRHWSGPRLNAHRFGVGAEKVLGMRHRDEPRRPQGLVQVVDFGAAAS